MYYCKNLKASGSQPALKANRPELKHSDSLVFDKEDLSNCSSSFHQWHCSEFRVANTFETRPVSVISPGIWGNTAATAKCTTPHKESFYFYNWQTTYAQQLALAAYANGMEHYKSWKENYIFSANGPPIFVVIDIFGSLLRAMNRNEYVVALNDRYSKKDRRCHSARFRLLTWSTYFRTLWKSIISSPPTF